MVSPSSNVTTRRITTCRPAGAYYLTRQTNTLVGLCFPVERLRHDLGAPSRIEVRPLAEYVLFETSGGLHGGLEIRRRSREQILDLPARRGGCLSSRGTRLSSCANWRPWGVRVVG